VGDLTAGERMLLRGSSQSPLNWIQKRTIYTVAGRPGNPQTPAADEANRSHAYNAEFPNETQAHRAADLIKREAPYQKAQVERLNASYDDPHSEARTKTDELTKNIETKLNALSRGPVGEALAANLAKIPGTPAAKQAVADALQGKPMGELRPVDLASSTEIIARATNRAYENAKGNEPLLAELKRELPNRDRAIGEERDSHPKNMPGTSFHNLGKTSQEISDRYGVALKNGPSGSTADFCNVLDNCGAKYTHNEACDYMRAYMNSNEMRHSITTVVENAATKSGFQRSPRGAGPDSPFLSSHSEWEVDVAVSASEKRKELGRELTPEEKQQVRVSSAESVRNRIEDFEKNRDPDARGLAAGRDKPKVLTDGDFALNNSKAAVAAMAAASISNEHLPNTERGHGPPTSSAVPGDPASALADKRRVLETLDAAAPQPGHERAPERAAAPHGPAAQDPAQPNDRETPRQPLDRQQVLQTLQGAAPDPSLIGHSNDKGRVNDR